MTLGCADASNSLPSIDIAKLFRFGGVAVDVGSFTNLGGSTVVVGGITFSIGAFIIAIGKVELCLFLHGDKIYSKGLRCDESLRQIPEQEKNKTRTQKQI